jgi:hypothetical protein
MEDVRRIADAVLYEGYVLWPYRRSALKNQRRFTFGGVHPRAHSERHPDDRWRMETRCLIEAQGDAAVDVAVRFLHVVRRDVGRDAGGGRLEMVDELRVGERRHLAWDEAVEREIAAPGLVLDRLAEEPITVPVAVVAGRAEEDLHDGPVRVGALVRTWEPLHGAVAISAERVAPRLHRLAVIIENRTPCGAGVAREEALRRTFCSTHTVLHAPAGGFVSATDPPDALREAAAACRNEGTWPVLVGAPGETHTVLSSPIILEDHPRIAPESPGDLFDSGEIDQLLILNILGLTDEEKAEMRATDPRTRAILERAETLSAEQLMRLHGTIRDFRAVG